MGVGVMTWGDAKGLARLHPAKTSYGGAHGFEEEKKALEMSIEAGVNLFDTAAIYSGGASERRLGELAHDKSVLIAYIPLASGALTCKYNAQTRPTGFFRRYMKNFRRKGVQALAPIVDLLREIGDSYSKSPSQVALQWLLENENVLPIPGSKNAKQAAENARALSFSLKPAEVEVLYHATLKPAT